MASQTVCTDNFLIDKYAYFHTGNMHLITTATYVCTTLHNIIKSLERRKIKKKTIRKTTKELYVKMTHTVLSKHHSFLSLILYQGNLFWVIWLS